MWILDNLGNFSVWFNNTGVLPTIELFIYAGFSDQSFTGQLVNAVPGSRLFSMVGKPDSLTLSTQLHHHDDVTT